jgi:uncharacterized membrane protein (Fun14 family)
VLFVQSHYFVVCILLFVVAVVLIIIIYLEGEGVFEAQWLSFLTLNHLPLRRGFWLRSCDEANQPC